MKTGEVIVMRKPGEEAEPEEAVEAEKTVEAEAESVQEMAAEQEAAMPEKAAEAERVVVPDKAVEQEKGVAPELEKAEEVAAKPGETWGTTEEWKNTEDVRPAEVPSQGEPSKAVLDPQGNFAQRSVLAATASVTQPAKPEETSAGPSKVHFHLNGQPISLPRKADGSPYFLMDMIQYSGIDLKQPKGRISLMVNGVQGVFLQQLREGDNVRIEEEM